MDIRARKIYEALFALEDSREISPINYDRWVELYWKKQLERITEEKKRGKHEKENLKTIERDYNALIKDKEIPEQIERIKEHEWVKIIEGVEDAKARNI